MKLHENKLDAYTVGLGEQKDYSIAINGHMMMLLSDGIYSDKIKAVIRELSTNAFDAHVDAGCPNKPFDVTLPTRLNPAFTIRDYGTGMSQEAMENMYRVYGVSTRQDSDDFTGCMGLGSKSPFAYTDSFTSISYYNGTKYTYINSKNQEGTPSLIFVSEEPTNEPNGLEISFACHIKDISNFTLKAQEVYKWFKVKPNVTPSISYSVEPVIIKGDGWEQRRGSDSYAVMGNVAYPIDPNQFAKQPDSHYHYYKENESIEFNALISGMILYFDTGEVSMDVSREKLQYNKRTIDAVKKKIAKIKTELESEVRKKIDDCKCRWDAYVIYTDYRNSIGLSLFKVLCPNMSWNGQKLGTILLDKHQPAFSCICDIGNLYPKRYHNVRTVSHERGKTAFYVADAKGHFAACGREMAAHNYHKVYIIQPEYDGQLDEIVNLLGITKEHLKYVSQVPKPVRQKNSYVYSSALMFHEKGGQNWRTTRSSTYWSDHQIEEDEFEEGGYYIEVNAYRVKINEEWVDADRFARMYNFFKSNNPKTPSLIGIKTKAIKKFDESKDWVNFMEFAREEIEEYVNKNNIASYVADSEVLSSLKGNSVDLIKCIGKKHLDKLDATHEVTKFVQSYFDLINSDGNFKGNSTYCAALDFIHMYFSDIKLNATSKYAHLPQDLQKIIDKYPVLRLSLYDMSYNQLLLIVNTIKLIDRS